VELTDQYAHMLAALLPRGPAWSKDDPLLLGLAPSLAAAHQRSHDLMSEIDPRRTTELINRYESICGLPDSCAPVGLQTMQQRQQRLDAKINVTGGINPEFYLAQLSALGYPTATITTFQEETFTCNSRCTDSLYSEEWRYYWQVNMPSSTTITDMTCLSDCTESLRFWGDTIAECVIQKLCPSHTYVIFKYPSE